MMAGLEEQAQWDQNVYQIEQTDPVVGGPPNLAQGQGITNVPHQALANRTAWLKAQVEALEQTLADLTNGAPGALDTLNELAAAIGDDKNFAATMTAALAGKLSIADTGDYMQKHLLPPDIDTLTKAGVYHMAGSANGSPGEGRLLHMPSGNDNEWSQIAITSHNKLLFRDKDSPNNPPGPWRLVATEGDDVATIPPGMIMIWTSDNPPAKWLECDGSAISRTSYDRLFAAIGTRYGSGVNTFNLPDLRGEFVRGWDNGRGIDAGRDFGSLQNFETGDHQHKTANGNDGAVSSYGFYHPIYGSEVIAGNSSTKRGGAWSQAGGSIRVNYTSGRFNQSTETRPRNIAQMFCIKY